MSIFTADEPDETRAGRERRRRSAMFQAIASRPNAWPVIESGEAGRPEWMGELGTNEWDELQCMSCWVICANAWWRSPWIIFSAYDPEILRRIERIAR